MTDFFIDPLSLAFMQRGFVAAVLVSIVASVVGAFVVLKGLAFIGDALAHSSFAGAATAFLMGGNIYLGAGIWAIAAAMAVGFIGQRARLKFDTAIGIIFAGGFALGIVLISRANNYTVDLFAFLFGNVLGVSAGDLLAIAIMGSIVLGLIALLYKELVFVSYDPTMAAASGLPVTILQYLLLAMIGITAVVGMKAVGLVLIVAMLVTPAATASLLTRRFPMIMLIGSGVGIASSVVGLYLSYHLEIASGATIVLVATSMFILTFVLEPRRGLIAQWRRMP